MLTANLVNGRRYQGKLRVTVLKGKKRAGALEAAEELIALLADHQGKRRHFLDEEFRARSSIRKEKRLWDGLWKLLLDECEFAEHSGADPVALRGELFALAAKLRAGSGDRNEPWRQQAIAQVAEAHGLCADTLADELFCDRKSEQRLLTVPTTSAEQLMERYDQAQVQAVLLRAVQVRVRLTCQDAARFRAFFAKLKFLQLLFSLRAAGGGEYALEIDGPFSLFSNSTKYGLKLASIVPYLEWLDSYELEADLRWGKDRTPLGYELSGGSARQGAKGSSALKQLSPPEVAADVVRLAKAFEAQKGPWECNAEGALLHLPGVGICVPDLTFVHGPSGQKVHFERLGFWSRAAVWKRVEMVEQGLAEPVIFAVSSRLRVSEEVLGEGAPSALYVYKGVMSAKQIRARLDALLATLGGARES